MCRHNVQAVAEPYTMFIVQDDDIETHPAGAILLTDVQPSDQSPTTDDQPSDPNASPSKEMLTLPHTRDVHGYIAKELVAVDVYGSTITPRPPVSPWFFAYKIRKLYKCFFQLTKHNNLS